MTHDRQHGHRRSIRLKGYDYTQPGAYFLTIVTHNRPCLFGDIVDGQMQLNEGGRVAERCWLDIPSHFRHVALDAFVIMPNHVHGILWIVDASQVGMVGAKIVDTSPVGANNPNVGAMNRTVGAKNFSPLRSTHSPIPSGPPLDDAAPPHGTSKTIGSVVRGFKIRVAKWFRQNTNIDTLWQRNYYEHVIRTDEALNRIREYILTNPSRWHLDRENPLATGHDGVWESLFRRSSSRRPRAGGRP